MIVTASKSVFTGNWFQADCLSVSVFYCQRFCFLIFRGNQRKTGRFRKNPPAELNNALLRAQYSLFKINQLWQTLMITTKNWM